MAPLVMFASRFALVHFLPMPPIRICTAEPLVTILTRHHQTEEMRSAYMLDQALNADQRTVVLNSSSRSPSLDLDFRVRFLARHVRMSDVGIPTPIASLDAASKLFLHLPPLLLQHHPVRLAFVHV